eukprot:10272957-Lingulodinium_polyedra.AAC.1
MMRSNRPSAAAAARESHGRALHANTKLAFAWSVRARGLRADVWVLFGRRWGSLGIALVLFGCCSRGVWV